jgi:CBS domain-containing protein
MNFASILRVLIPEIAGGLSGKIESFGISLAFAQADSQDLDENRASFRARVIRNAETRVKEVMLKVRGTIDADADLLDGLRLIYQNKLTVLPGFEKGKLIGVLRECDLFLWVAEVLAE